MNAQNPNPTAQTPTGKASTALGLVMGTFLALGISFMGGDGPGRVQANAGDAPQNAPATQVVAQAQPEAKPLARIERAAAAARKPGTAQAKANPEADAAPVTMARVQTAPKVFRFVRRSAEPGAVAVAMAGLQSDVERRIAKSLRHWTGTDSARVRAELKRLEGMKVKVAAMPEVPHDVIFPEIEIVAPELPARPATQESCSAS